MTEKQKKISLVIMLAFFILACRDKTEDKSIDKRTEVILQSPLLSDWTKAIEQHPDNPQLYYERSVILSRNDQDSLALSDLKKAVSLDSTNVIYISGLAQVFLNLRHADEAVKILQKGLELKPHDINLKLLLINAFIENNQTKDSEAMIQSIIDRHSDFADAYYWQARQQLALKDTGAALSLLTQALRLDTNYYAASLLLADCYSAMQQSKAVKQYLHTYYLDTTDALPLFEIGYYYELQLELDSAKKYYTRTFLNDRNYIYAYIQTGKILIRQDSLDKAIRIFNMATAADPANPDGYFYKGHAYELKGKIDSAKHYFEQCLYLQPDYKDAQDALLRLENN